MDRRISGAVCFFLRLLAGGLGYNLLELAWRGFTHISMTLLGGVCFSLLYHLSGKPLHLALKCVVGAGVITVGEFLVGCVVNLWLQLNVWDYSEEAYHILGQICPKFFVLWCLLCLVVLPVCGYAKKRFGKPRQLQSAG